MDKQVQSMTKNMLSISEQVLIAASGGFLNPILNNEEEKKQQALAEG